MSNCPPLQDILVLDFTRAVAGPFCTMNLADLGARVIKVEEPGIGDETRRWGPPFIGDTSAYFLSLNRNKESLAVDLKNEEDLALLRRIAKKADVVIENFRPGVADRLGVGYKELSAGNRGLIYASVSGFGQDGPERARPGYDLVIQAMSGLMLANALPGGPPMKVAFPVADVMAAMFVGQGILAWLYRRAQTGEGRYLEVSLLEGLLATMCSVAPCYLLTGEDPGALGAGQANIVPYQVFATEDAPVIVGVPNNRIWERFCRAAGCPHWLEDPRFLDNPARNRNRAVVLAEISRVMLQRPAAHWLQVLEEYGIPTGPVLTIAEIFEHPQVKERGTVIDAGGLRMVGNPMRAAGVETQYLRPPAIGEQNTRIREEFA